ncbi:YihY/virulence factor BrkB family protein [Roseivivax sp. CAU 1761]
MTRNTRSRSETRGRSAERPREIPGPGWRDILWRVYAEISADHVSVVAAGTAFFGLLALFPALGALVALAGLILEPATVAAQFDAMVGVLPPEAADILQSQMTEVAGASETGIGAAAILGFLLSLYSASKGTQTLMEGMNIAYDEEETRGFVARYATALLLTLLLIVGAVIALAATVAVPALLEALPLPGAVETLISVGRWVILAGLAILGFAILYRYGPSRDAPKWRWVSVGAVVATVLWILGSLAFSVYVQNFGSYNESFGAIGGVIVLLTWLWLSAFIVLLGAELNSEMEHQTRRDTTTGPREPMGERGAVKADTLGEVP